MTNLALFDMDGTLANDAHRKADYVAGKWSEYWNHEKMLADELFPEAEAEFRRVESEGWDIMILTARLHSYNWALTSQWLEAKGLNVKGVMLRPDDMSWMRPPEFKTDVIKMLKMSGKYEKIVLFENDPEVVAMITKVLGAEYVSHCTWELTQGA